MPQVSLLLRAGICEMDELVGTSICSVPSRIYILNGELLGVNNYTTQRCTALDLHIHRHPAHAHQFRRHCQHHRREVGGQ